MENLIIILIFVAGYLLIAFETSLKLNKAASALLIGVLCWLVLIMQRHAKDVITDALMHNLGEIASILFFLLGAMTIVELIDSHNGFYIITRKIVTTSKVKLLFIIVLITFFLSAVLDNLTTAIVMSSLCTRLLNDKNDRLWFVGMIVIASNAGGVWSPLGDVTTTMLWIGGQITPYNIIKTLFLPGFLTCMIPALIIARRFKGQHIACLKQSELSNDEIRDGRIILLSGGGFLIFVPFFKTITHLPPFMGILLALGIMWIVTTLLHKNKQTNQAEQYSVSAALQKIDTPSILFFLGILLAVSALQSAGVLKHLSYTLTNTFKSDYLVGIVLGLLSALVDNVPLVAATQGMFDVQSYPTDHPFWEFLALTTGTGGSVVIIGSAAGVAAMGIEQIDFMWYLKRISWIALLGFVTGIVVFFLQSLI